MVVKAEQPGQQVIKVSGFAPQLGVCHPYDDNLGYLAVKVGATL
jgi:hypothetical protein